ncbi:ABC transporter ATP-binding protein [Roseovarius sp.]|uniref:ABC transporter ATP-binding protein n=1 Tax=Roseovarius sp. TaxID=1486281 RepID=UPI00261A2928|nr:ABC transporter ATP-binding protein [Roseovarius sp.]MDM8165604.1 ABC transporter ATP-binding protein [Roseovarius sp.]
MLQVDGLTLGYAGIRVLEEVSLRVRENTVTTLVGSNGAGKSTLMKGIMGLKPPLAGEVRLDGIRLAGLSTSEIVARGVVLVPEGRELFPKMTVLENLQVGASLGGDEARKKRNLATVTELFPVLGRKLSMAARNLSGGEQQMLAVGRALMASPRFLLLDEPSIGLAPLIEEQLMASIRQVANELGLGVLLVEQNAMLALEHSDWAYVIELGRITKSVASAELVDDPSIVDAYLGG